jgi:aspartate aminotransferase
MKPLSRKVASLEESQTLLLTQRARAMRDTGIDVVSFTAGEPDFPTPDVAKQAAVKAIEENFTHYTANAGIAPLLKAVSEKFERENSLHYAPSQILVSCGAKHSIFNALQAICNPGDEVIIPAPYWVSYPEMVKLVDAVPVFVLPSNGSGNKITADELRAAVTARTKAIIFNSPSNPSGAVYSQSEIENLGEVVREHGLFVIADEIYEKIVYDGMKHFSMGSIPGLEDLVVTVNGVSKAFAMTGWRIGYMGAAKPVIEAAGKVQSQVTSNATSIAQRAALAALQHAATGEMVREFQRRRDFMVGALRKSGRLEFQVPPGAFYLLPSMERCVGLSWKGGVIANDSDFAQFLLEEARVAVVPGYCFGARNHVRISYACGMAELEKGANTLNEAIGRLSA